jgi:hypothetical protein
VSVGKQTDEQAFDQVLLPNDHFADGLAQSLDELALFSDLFLDIAAGSAFCHLYFLMLRRFFVTSVA